MGTQSASQEKGVYEERITMTARYEYRCEVGKVPVNDDAFDMTLKKKPRRRIKEILATEPIRILSAVIAGVAIVVVVWFLGIR